MNVQQRFFRSCLAVFVILSATWRAAGAPLGDRLVNISARAKVGINGNELIGGFVIAGSGAKKILITGIGPRLTEVGVAGALADPVLTLYDVQGAPIISNDNWSSADAATLASVGGGPFTVGSKDAVLVITLAPGVYSAIIKGANNTTGEGMVEVYDVSDGARFVNLSARAVVGPNALVAGLVVTNSPGNLGAVRRLLVRAAGPMLSGVGVSGALSDPMLTIYNGKGAIIATNDNWGSNDLSSLATYQQQAGATPFPAGSKDSAVVFDAAPGNYSMHVTGIGGVTGVTVLEAFDITPDNQSTPVISVTATTSATSSGSTPAVFTLTRLGSTAAALTVNYTLSGTAVVGTDYTGPTGTATFAVGAGTTTVNVSPVISSSTTSTSAPAKTATLTLASSNSYDLGLTKSADVTIFYDGGTLYVANLRPPTTAASSTAYGTATIQLSADERFITTNTGFSNLGSTQTVSYLRIAETGGQIVDLFLLPNGQVSGSVWAIAPIGSYTVSDIVAALKAGKAFVSIETVNNPAGELSGTFLRNTGSQIFTVPPAPPALPTTPPTQAEAARFLMQATFGPKQAEIDALVLKGYATWIDEQMAKPQTLHRTAIMADFAIDGHDATVATAAPSGTNRQAAWWKTTITGDDQLRQRMAFALSQIFVISEANTTLGNYQEAMANYYDILVRNSFGNFRTLLEEVTLSPMMGIYLSSLRNSKATATTSPDENYAREVMQLFSIGLNQLQPDGTLKLGTNGLPLTTYDQTTITEMAKVFTGLDWYSTTTPPPNFRSVPANYFGPMKFYTTTNTTLGHETSAKTIVTGRVLPANQTAVKDLADTLDTLFNHPNAGPFLSRQLIQRFVTSNPSPGYVYRVAQVFANNGAGVRGDLGAVLRAILTDYEARSSVVAGNPGFGKLKEPLLRVTALLRAFDAVSTATTGNNVNRYNYSNPEAALVQAALRAPTVFNFYEPYYIVPGALAAAGLYAPEYQILTDNSAINLPNQLYTFIFSSVNSVTCNYAAFLPLARQPGPLVDQLNTLLCAGSLKAAQKTSIVNALNGMATNTSDIDRVRNAIYLILTTPAGATQK